MPLDGTYSTGTASVTTGSKIVTGQGTLWLAHVKPGDKFYNGWLIDTVDSNTQITLLLPWPHAPLVAAPYVIEQSALSRSPASVQAEELTTIAAVLRQAGVIYTVPTGGTPDPDIGEDGQYALDFDNGKWWKKIAGVWTGPHHVNTPASTTIGRLARYTGTNGSLGQADYIGGSNELEVFSGKRAIFYNPALSGQFGLGYTVNDLLLRWNFNNGASIATLDNVGNAYFAGSLGVGAAPPAFAKEWVHVATDANLAIRGPVNLGSGITLQALNDATNANVPFEIETAGAELRLTASPVRITGSLGIGVAPYTGVKCHIHVGTDQNIWLRSGTGPNCDITSINDAVNGFMPLRINALHLQLNPDSGGFVGIGFGTTPLAKLHVRVGTDENLLISTPVAVAGYRPARARLAAHL